MRKNILYFYFIALLFLACADKNASKSEAISDSISKTITAFPAVETQNKVSNLQPAFTGQTRIAGAKTTTKYSSEILTKGLIKPWSVKALPDGRLLVTEKEGTLRIVSLNGDLSEKIIGLPKVNSDGQGGLLDVCLDPDFADNKTLYYSYSEKTSKGNLTAVGKGKLSNDEKSIENSQTIYRAFPAYIGTLHYGSRLVFDGKGNLYVSTGERSDIETRPQAQWLNSALGKIVRITKDGKAVVDNPFVNNAKSFPELYSYGHRNVQGLAIHPISGDLWETEMGPKGGDELNLIKAGENYGWPLITYGIEYSGESIGKSISQQEGLTQPIYYWDPVISPSGITFYHNGSIPEWENNLFIACLSGRHIARIVLKDNKVIGEERLLESENERFRDITQGQNGALFAVTDSGKLYKIYKN